MHGYTAPYLEKQSVVKCQTFKQKFDIGVTSCCAWQQSFCDYSKKELRNVRIAPCTHARAMHTWCLFLSQISSSWFTYCFINWSEHPVKVPNLKLELTNSLVWLSRDDGFNLRSVKHWLIIKTENSLTLELVQWKMTNQLVAKCTFRHELMLTFLVLLKLQINCK